MKGISKMVWIAITLFVAAVAIGLLVYWFFGWGGRTGGALTQAECQMKHQRACESWANSGFPQRMYDRITCSYGEPGPCCGIQIGGGATDDCINYPDDKIKIIEGQHWVGAAGCNWWDCIAPGCAANFGIDLYDKADCGAE